MDIQSLEQLIRVWPFPTVIHPRHARELQATDESARLAEWAGGYGITVPEHREMLEDLLGSLAWGDHGCAVLINGMYGTGKSHLLVLLHLLATMPQAWEAFLRSHPGFRRYAGPMQGRRWLVAHISLDEYGPRQSLECALSVEMQRICQEADLLLPNTLTDEQSRLDTWAAIQEAAQARGYHGLLVLIDELSMFLAGRSPAKREADAAFLQFLAGWTTRAPVWLIGAMQRALSNVGPLRAHSWRQVEDRFRRYALSPQQIGDLLRDKLIERLDPAAIRSLVAQRIVPAVESVGLPLSAGDLQRSWPFHPHTVDLMMTIVNGHLSPHRSAVEVFQGTSEYGLLRQPSNRLMTVLDLLPMVREDLRNWAGPEKLWTAVDLLQGCVEQAPEPDLARQVVDLLTLLHLAERPLSVAQMRVLLFNGEMAPSVSRLSAALHALRRHGAYLSVMRDADPGEEVFRLAIDDEVGALARMRMQDMRHDFIPVDPRITEAAMQASAGAGWPLAGCGEGLRVQASWCGSERPVQAMLLPAISSADILQACEGLLAGQVDGHALLVWPGTDSAPIWQETTASLSGPHTGVLLLWIPREPTAAERELWAEYAAWERAAEDPNPPANTRERAVRKRCREWAEELRAAVAGSMQALYREGQWCDAAGNEGFPTGQTLAESLADMLAPGFEKRFPAFPALSPSGTPSRAAAQQLLASFIDPGEAQVSAQSLLADYIERFAVPLGCAEITGPVARLIPPKWELIDPLLSVMASGPLRIADALALLRKPPYGLSAEQAEIVLRAAVKTGALVGLDGFLQLLNLEQIALSRSDALAFVAPPAEVDAKHRSLVLQLADAWGIAPEPWPIACSQVERRLRADINAWGAQTAAVRAALAEWSQTLQAPPWVWQTTERRLSTLERWAGSPAISIEEMLAALAEEAEAGLTAFARIVNAAEWWRQHRQAASVLTVPMPDHLISQASRLREVLVTGEAGFAQLAEITDELTAFQAAYTDDYQRWHEEIFGAEAVAELRAVFDSPDFRAVKALSRLPLPAPDTAADCLNALAQARANYCPGIFGVPGVEVGCARCRLPYGSPSPMPDSARVREWAAAAISAYGESLRTHPWVEGIRERLPRAPEAMATRAKSFLAWSPENGAQTLVDLLDESLIAWLSREQPAAGVRHMRQFESRLQGRELTRAEAEHAFLDWLDPEDTLQSSDVIAFE